MSGEKHYYPCFSDAGKAQGNYSLRCSVSLLAEFEQSSVLLQDTTLRPPQAQRNRAPAPVKVQDVGLEGTQPGNSGARI